MKRAKVLPPLPDEIYHPLGPIPVRIVDNLKDDDGKDIFGYWDPYAREIQLRGGMHATAGWLTLEHETAHAYLSEIGIALSTDQEEAIVNAIAAIRVAQMLASL